MLMQYSNMFMHMEKGEELCSHHSNQTSAHCEKKGRKERNGNRLRTKQHMYPVLMLVVGDTNRYVPYVDSRCSDSKLAINFAASSNLLGVNLHSEELIKVRGRKGDKSQDNKPVKLAKMHNLVVFVWGNDLNVMENQKKVAEMGVDGLIYDGYTLLLLFPSNLLVWVNLDCPDSPFSTSRRRLNWPCSSVLSHQSAARRCPSR